MRSILLPLLCILTGCPIREARRDTAATPARVAGQPAFLQLEDTRDILASLQPPPRDSAPESDGAVLVPVFYATDRVQTGSTRPDGFYGAQRGALKLGVAKVTVPKRIRPAVLSATVGGYQV